MSQANPFMITAVGRLHNFDKDQELYADELAVLRQKLGAFKEAFRKHVENESGTVMVPIEFMCVCMWTTEEIMASLFCTARPRSSGSTRSGKPPCTKTTSCLLRMESGFA